jgi:hypothetical protein
MSKTAGLAGDIDKAALPGKPVTPRTALDAAESC